MTLRGVPALHLGHEGVVVVGAREGVRQPGVGERVVDRVVAGTAVMVVVEVRGR